jgi:hypothetical protein
MSLRGHIVDVSAQDTYPVSPQIDLTESPTATASGWSFTNLHDEITIWVSETGENVKTSNADGDKFAVLPKQSFSYNGNDRKFFVRAAQTGTDVLLAWVSV